MNCKNCGGELRFEKGVAVCDSCNSTYKSESFIENIDVCICCIENDGNGRRTKDSLIAQEVYRKLDAVKIRTFYERISASAFFGDDLEFARYSAVYFAKIILVVGADIENFRSLSEKYKEHFEQKTVVPVYADINASDIPTELGRYQALNYATIGWEKDLERGLFRLLGREKETDPNAIRKKTKNKRNIIIASAIVIILTAAIILSLPFFDKMNKTVITPEVSDTAEQVTEEQTAPPLTNQQIYDSALAMEEAGHYLEAIDEYTKIPGFKDSENRVKSIYDRYDGYYANEEQGCYLYLNIIDGGSAEVRFEKAVNGKLVVIDETVVFTNNSINGVYIDNLSNTGLFTVMVNNEGVEAEISTDTTDEPISIGNITVPFLLADKSDRPPMKTVNMELLLSWVTNLTYIDDITTAGYELEYSTDGNYIGYEGDYYTIANTDIRVVVSDCDYAKYTGQQWDDRILLSQKAVLAIFAPASMVCPDRIGQTAQVFSDNGTVYAPGTDYMTYSNTTKNDESYIDFATDSIETSYWSNENYYITTDMMVGFASKNTIGKFNYDIIISANTEAYYEWLVYQQFVKDNPGTTSDGVYTVHLLSEKNNAVLICVHTETLMYGAYENSVGYFHYYKLNPSTKTCSLIAAYPREHYYNQWGSLEYSYDIWQSYPDIFSEFIT